MGARESRFYMSLEQRIIRIEKEISKLKREQRIQQDRNTKNARLLLSLGKRFIELNEDIQKMKISENSPVG